MPPLCAVPQANGPAPHGPEAFRGGPLPAGSSPGRSERTLVLFPVRLFSPSLGSLLLQGLLGGLLLAREVERLFFWVISMAGGIFLLLQL